MVIKKELQKVFGYYNKKYNLMMFLTFVKNHPIGCMFDANFGMINIDMEQVKKSFKEKETKLRHSYKNLTDLATIILLHEIGHAIHYQKNSQEYIKLSNIQHNYVTKTWCSIEEYIQLPLEKYADNFAKKEIKKWR